jgi:carbamoyl-phosphate synthase small subunit
MKKGLLILEDGNIYKGIGFGASGTSVGELVFNTAMSGYQKMLTDPSYCGQIINLTYPLIGNYGVSKEDYESEKIHAFGVVIRDLSFRPANRKCVMTFSDWLEKMGVPGIHSVDTRDITMKIREHGSMKALISNEDISIAEAKAQMASTVLRLDYMKSIGVSAARHIPGKGKRIAILDFGIKTGIIRHFEKRGCDIHIFPYYSSAREIVEVQPAGIFLSNGPGDPEAAIEGIETVKALLGANIPIFGICMGHQILALALGAKTFKLKFGHRGGNHGVLDKDLDKAFITSQNHSYAVAPDSCGEDILITHTNLNDGTVEGLRHRSLPFFSVQYHPEGSPGPNDNEYLFDKFLEAIGGE